MPSQITFKGVLDPVDIEDSFGDVLQSLNMQAREGKTFVSTRASDGQWIMFRMDEVGYIRETEDDFTL